MRRGRVGGEISSGQKKEYERGMSRPQGGEEVEGEGEREVENEERREKKEKESGGS